MKLPISSSTIQRSTKLPVSLRFHARFGGWWLKFLWGLDVGIWSFTPGAWRFSI